MRPPGLRELYAYVTERDYQRVRSMALADGLTISDFFRGCIDDYLEAVGEQPLDGVPSRGPRRNKESEDDYEATLRDA